MNVDDKTMAPKAQRPRPNSAPLKRTSRGPRVPKGVSVTGAATDEEERAFLRAIIAGCRPRSWP